MVNWNAEADAKLLAIILDIHQVKVDVQAVAARFGEGQHYIRSQSCLIVKDSTSDDRFTNIETKAPLPKPLHIELPISSLASKQ